LLAADGLFLLLVDAVSKNVYFLVRWADTCDDRFAVLGRINVQLVVFRLESLRAKAGAKTLDKCTVLAFALACCCETFRGRRWTALLASSLTKEVVVEVDLARDASV